MNQERQTAEATQPVTVVAGSVELPGDLGIPEGANGLVMFAHGSGSSRHSPRNQAVAESFRRRGLGTLLFDLLTAEEDQRDRVSRELRFDIDMLGQRVVQAIDWLATQPGPRNLALGLFGSSTGAAAALIGAAQRPERVHAVVSRGGRPDLAEKVLGQVKAPTLLIVGGNDAPVIDMNKEAMQGLTGAKSSLALVPGASHLFEEPGTLEEAARLAGEWFQRYLVPGEAEAAGPES